MRRRDQFASTPDYDSHMNRGVLSLIWTACLIPWLMGCAGNTWKDHYHPTGEPAAATLEKTAAVKIERRPLSTLSSNFTPEPGERILGESRFESQYAPSNDRLISFARTLGATKVYLASEFSRTRYSEGYTSMPRDISSRGAATVTNADGTQSRVVMDSTTTVWESIPYSRTDDLYQFLAIYVTPERTSP